MKRTIAAAAAVLIVMSMFTGCGKKNQDNAAQSETSSSVSETVSETMQTSESVTESSVSSETAQETSAENVETVNPLNNLAQAALAVGEWPMMDEVTDENIIADYFLLDKNDPNYINLIVMQCPMSANMSELIIIEAEDTSAAADALKERRKKAQDTDAFYPADQEKAKNAIVGTSGKYAYYILSSEPEKSEEAILMSIE
ncbi:MAG: DUF4358 domain-containing protein [Oscillospiraceae bacterium]|nr:DUF4358 domain-containing protein [Oscillospiraceae bacterium]